MFFLAFSNIEESEKMSPVKIAVVKDDNFMAQPTLQSILSELSNARSENQIFELKYTNESKAKTLLENQKVVGYLKMEKEHPNIYVKKNGIEETIFESVMTEIVQTSSLIDLGVKSEIKSQGVQLTREELSEIYLSVQNKINSMIPNVKDESPVMLSYMMIEYYTLIAMACLYGAMFGMFTMNQTLANMSKKGARVAVSALPKGKLLVANMLASYTIQLIGLGILFIYTIFVLNVNYGSNLWEVILLSFAGALAGLSLGTMVGAIMRTSEDMKIGIIVSITMLGCFLSGMMGVVTKYYVDQFLPWINRINPANLITDGFNCLYQVGKMDQFWIDFCMLLAFSIIMLLIALTRLRRNSYDSI